ncbi:glycine cleavage system protein GcvH [Myxococcota bacterium]|nr:glycine cleavage system protein GcvH [Myxococcota bacterium]
MSDFQLPENLQYTRDDEWVKAETDGHYQVGITDYAQQQLGDIVFVELPSPGDRFEAGQPFGVVESVKAVSDLFAPMSMEILEVNQDLEETPESINAECYGVGWLIRVQVTKPEELEQLLDRKGYEKTIEELS